MFLWVKNGGSLPECVCGHSREAHEHYRPGADCALCEAGGCPRFRAQRVGAKDGSDAAPDEEAVLVALPPPSGPAVVGGFGAS